MRQLCWMRQLCCARHPPDRRPPTRRRTGDRRGRLPLADGDPPAGVAGPTPASAGPSTPRRLVRSAAANRVHADLEKSSAVDAGETVGLASRM